MGKCKKCGKEDWWFNLVYTKYCIDCYRKMNPKRYTPKKATKNSGNLDIFLGVILFFIRYIPILDNKSIDSISQACNTNLRFFMVNCDVIKPLNIGLIIGSIALVAYGIYQNIQNNNKKDDSKEKK